jgi:hypothetical protein
MRFVCELDDTLHWKGVKAKPILGLTKGKGEPEMKNVLQADESLLYHRERIRLAVYKSPPTVHAAGSVPGLHAIDLSVTDRRVIVRGAILGGVPVTQFDLWYPRGRPSDECDVLERVSAGKRAGSTYLHLTARAREHGPLRSDVAELYLYLDDAERIEHMLKTCLAAEPVEWR